MLNPILSAIVRQAVENGGLPWLQPIQAELLKTVMAGKLLTGATINSQTLTFAVNQNLTPSQMLGFVEEAIQYMRSHSPDEVEAMLSGNQVSFLRFGITTPPL